MAEGPGHCRDTELLLEQSDLEHAIRTERSRFVDLNLDNIHPVALASNYTKLSNISFSETLLGADLIVSLPKLKTHHWAGVTLSMKNLFGVVPGIAYGWPKNVLHWAGIHESILDICATVRPHFVIADGIIAMEGDGPLNGTPKALNTILLADDPVTADSALAQLLGFNPWSIQHIREASQFIGNLSKPAVSRLA